MKSKLLAVGIIFTILSVIGFSVYKLNQPRFSDDKADVEMGWLMAIADANEWHYQKKGIYPSGTIKEITVALSDNSTTDSQYLMPKFFNPEGHLIDGWGTPVRIAYEDGNIVVNSAGRNKNWGDNDDHTYKEPLDKTYEHGPPSNFTEFYK